MELERCETCQVYKMTPESMKALMKEALKEELVAIGIAATSASEQIAMQDDLRFIRAFRRIWQGSVEKIGTAVVLILLATAAVFVAPSIATKIGKFGP